MKQNDEEVDTLLPGATYNSFSCLLLEALPACHTSSRFMKLLFPPSSIQLSRRRLADEHVESQKDNWEQCKFTGGHDDGQSSISLPNLSVFTVAQTVNKRPLLLPLSQLF